MKTISWVRKWLTEKSVNEWMSVNAAAVRGTPLNSYLHLKLRCKNNDLISDWEPLYTQHAPANMSGLTLKHTLYFYLIFSMTSSRTSDGESLCVHPLPLTSLSCMGKPLYRHWNQTHTCQKTLQCWAKVLQAVCSHMWRRMTNDWNVSVKAQTLQEKHP